jgi:hypothetical protein
LSAIAIIEDKFAIIDKHGFVSGARIDEDKLCATENATYHQEVKRYEKKRRDKPSLVVSVSRSLVTGVLCLDPVSNDLLAVPFVHPVQHTPAA